MRRAILSIAVLAALIPGAASPQDGRPAPVPSAPGGAGPTWQRTLRLSDGRTFVTDGAMAIDATLAKPATLPADVLPPASASLIERHMAAQSPDEFGLSQLSPRPDARTYRTPSGVDLNRTYVDFLRRALPPARVRLRTRGGREPVVVLLDGRPVGVLMPVAR
jgi:hypothetical protein